MGKAENVLGSNDYWGKDVWQSNYCLPKCAESIPSKPSQLQIIWEETEGVKVKVRWVVGWVKEIVLKKWMFFWQLVENWDYDDKFKKFVRKMDTDIWDIEDFNKKNIAKTLAKLENEAKRVEYIEWLLFRLAFVLQSIQSLLNEFIIDNNEAGLFPEISFNYTVEKPKPKNKKALRYFKHDNEKNVFLNSWRYWQGLSLAIIGNPISQTQNINSQTDVFPLKYTDDWIRHSITLQSKLINSISLWTVTIWNRNSLSLKDWDWNWTTNRYPWIIYEDRELSGIPLFYMLEIKAITLHPNPNKKYSHIEKNHELYDLILQRFQDLILSMWDIWSLLQDSRQKDVKAQEEKKYNKKWKDKRWSNKEPKADSLLVPEINFS